VELHRFIIDAFDDRLKGDYGPRGAVSPEQAQEHIAHAEQFLKVAEEHFGPVPPPQAAEAENS